MADSGKVLSLTTVPSCDYKALKECLDRNNGNRSKCMREWEEFQRSCAENKRKLQEKRDPSPCGCD